MERRLAAILAADVVGYSRLVREDEAGTLAALKAHLEELIDPKITERNGRIVKLMGDGLLAEFPSAVEAVQCAVDIQHWVGVRTAELAEDRRVVYRVGINIGDIVVEGDDIYGDGVNIAARLEGLAEPGGICVRRNVRNQVRDKLDLAFEDMGEVEIKNISRPVRAFRVVLDDKAAALVTPVTKATVASWRSRRPVVAAALALSLSGVFGLVWWQTRAPDIAPPTVEQAVLSLPDKPSIVVLPFLNVSGDPEQEYFADGMTDDLITDLSKLSGLFVISRNSAFAYKNKAVNVPDVARELGVRFVLEGSARREGSTVRINAQLIDSRTGGHVWADRYDGSIEDIFALQDQVIGQIVEQLKVQLSVGEQNRITRIPTKNLEAYDYYLRAEEEGYYVADSARYRMTLGYYQKAIELDPEFASAYAGYARATVEVLRLGFDNLLSGAVARKNAYDAASRALQLEPQNARTLTVLAILQTLDSRHKEAIESARQAVAYSPSSAEAQINLGLVLAYAGQRQEAVKAVETALRLNPKSEPGVYLLAGVVYYFDRQYERAIASLEEARTELPTSEIALQYLAASYARLERLDEARAMFESLRQILPMLSLAFYRLQDEHVKEQDDLDHLLGGLQKAGITPWPFGYQERTDGRLSGADIEAIANGKTWEGVLYNGVPFIQQNTETGGFAYSSANSLRTGTFWVAGDQLCQRVPGYLLGRAACGYVYRNGDQGEWSQYRYIYVSPELVKFFSPAS
jgi:adenylate cyclase